MTDGILEKTLVLIFEKKQSIKMSIHLIKLFNPYFYDTSLQTTRMHFELSFFFFQDEFLRIF